MDIEKDSNREAFEAIAENIRLLRGAKFKDGEYVALSLFDESSKELAAQLNYGWAMWLSAKAQAVQGWISVQGRMPEQGQKVLVFRPDAHNHPHKDPNFKICTYAGADIFINSHFEHAITHWKPITAPVEVKEPAND